METDDSDRSRPNVTAGLVTFAGIFGAAFSVAAFLLPAGDLGRKLVLAVLLASLSALLWRGVVAFARGRLDPVFAALTAASLGLVTWYAVLAVGERDRQLDALRSSVGPTPSATTTTTGSTTSSTTTSAGPATTTAAGLGEFAPSREEVYSSGVAEIELDRYGLIFDSHHRWGTSSGWGGSADGTRSDISFSESGIIGRDGTGFALVGEGEPKSFERCRDQADWAGSLTWQQVRKGSFVCLRAVSGRRGLLRVDEMPDPGADRKRVTVTGIVWATVNR
ncbi:hypothetical protein GCM10027184_62270 [Saccharothrix stipae]